MFKKYLKSIACGLAVLFAAGHANAQIGLDFDDTTICPGTPLQMCATISGDVNGLSSDDMFSSIIQIGFNFTFFGNTYTELAASANNFVTFNPSKAAGYSSYTWAGATNAGDLDNTILMAFQDTDFGVGGQIRYQTSGSAPNRKFVLEFCQVPQFGGVCNNNLVTNQLILYETSNVIEINNFHLPQTSTCPSTTPGWAVQGVRSPNSIIQIYSPDRGPADFWGQQGADMTARRYTPDGADNYIIDTIPFAPVLIINAADTSNLTWYQEGSTIPIANGACANVITQANVNYYVVKYEGYSCSSTDSILVAMDTVNIHFGVTYDTIDVEICQGESYNFAGSLVFQPGQYDTLFVNSMGCDSNLTLNLVINPLPEVELYAPITSICEGDSLVITNSNPSSFGEYQWYNGGYPIDGATGDNLVVSAAGSYYLIGLTDKGCTDTSSRVNVTMNPAAEAEITSVSRLNVCFEDTVTVAAKEVTNSQYHWSPEQYFRTDASYFYPQATAKVMDWNQPVQLLVINQWGCRAYDTTVLTGHPCCDVYFPSGFSPNGDGLNDFFAPLLRDYQKMNVFSVFDRYGKEVFKSTIPNKGWDGFYPDGKEAASDVYMYFIQYTCTDGQIYTEKGDITLTR